VFLLLSFWGGLWSIPISWILDRLPRNLIYYAAAVCLGVLPPNIMTWFVIFPLKGLSPVTAGASIGVFNALIWSLGARVCPVLVDHDDAPIAGAVCSKVAPLPVRSSYLRRIDPPQMFVAFAANASAPGREWRARATWRVRPPDGRLRSHRRSTPPRYSGEESLDEDHLLGDEPLEFGDHGAPTPAPR